MLDSILQTAAEFIYGGLNQIGITGADLESIKLCLEISVIIILLWRLIRRNKRKVAQNPATPNYPTKGFRPPRWTSDGHYYDEEKQRWIGPDFKKKDN